MRRHGAAARTRPLQGGRVCAHVDTTATFPTGSLKRQTPRAAQVSIFGPETALCPFAQPFECPSALLVVTREPPRAQILTRSRVHDVETCSRVAAHRRCVRMLQPLPKNVFSSRLVLTLAITTHPPRCCVDHATGLLLGQARQCAEWLRRAKSPKRSPAGVAPSKRHRDSDYGAQEPLF